MSDATTRAMAELVVSLERSHISDDVVDLVTRAFVDSLGCGLVGSLQPDGAIARGWVESLGGNDEATLFGGRGSRAPAALAALANGTTMHALDYDDFILKRMMHPSVVYVPLTLALGERLHASGEDVILAFVAGFEVASRISRAIIPEHYAKGWHSTSTIGGLGAAAAAARLLELDADGVAQAVAIAASSAAGLRDNFGTMVKPLHAGNAAFHGIMAAELVAGGFTASRSILDGERSYIEVYRNDDATLAPEDFALEGELEIETSGITFKRYTCCGAIHAALDATLELRAEHGLTPEKIASMRCAVHPRAPEILIHHTASTPEQGRFCVEWSLAVAIADGDAGIPQYTEARLEDPIVQDLSRKVDVFVDEALALNEGAATAISNSVVTVETTDGDVFEHRVPPHRPMSWAELERKFRSSASLVLDDAAAENALQLARGLAGLDDVGALARAFA
ncbi:MAG TPA: MmgE/PrpD family protein [Gaiellaceae bacterium]|jgi:2-methylcitrate dehydratase PrpD